MKSLFSRPFSSSRGLTLLETALALAILGLVIAGVWVVSGSAFGSNKKNQLAEQVISTVENVRSYMRNVDLGTTTLNTNQAWNLGLLPADVRKGGNYRNPYGGNFTITLSNTSLIIGLSTVPSEACVDLLYARLGGGDVAASNIGFDGYEEQSTGSPSTDFSFNGTTGFCSGNPQGILLYFQPR